MSLAPLYNHNIDINMATPHVVVVPFPAPSHLNPCLSLAHFLASSGLSLTLVQTTHFLTGPSGSKAAPLMPSPPSASLLHQSNGTSTPAASDHTSPFRTEVIPGGFVNHSLPFPITTFMASLDLMRKEFIKLLERLMLEENSPVCLLVDIFIPWGRAVAVEFGLIHVCLCTMSASLFCLGCHVLDLAARGFIPANEEGAKNKIVDFIPGLSPFRVADVPKSLAAEEGLQSDRFLLFSSFFQNAKSADRILVNTIYELESSAIEALRTEDHVHIHPIGPLFMTSTMTPASQLLEEKDSCLSWLDEQEKCSVLYIAFGTLASIEDEVLAELAHGLEASGEKFVWVIKLDPHKAKERVEEILPEGFMERTRGRGRVISWAPQLAVLGHSSVGGFLTHCGWNSVMEGLSNGVPMLGFPQIAEQNFNLKLMVHDWKVALPLLIDSRALHLELKQEQGKLVERSRVQGGIRGMMRGDEGKEVRKRARDWKEVAMRQGSSEDNLHKLAHDLKHGLL